MDVVPYLPADPQAAKPVQVGEGALYDAVLGAQSGTVLGAAAGDHRFYPAVPHEAAVLVVIVATVAEYDIGTAPGPAALAPHGRHGFEQRDELWPWRT